MNRTGLDIPIILCDQQPLGARQLVTAFAADLVPADVIHLDEVHLSVGAKGATRQSGRIFGESYKSIVFSILFRLITAEFRNLQTISMVDVVCRTWVESSVTRVFVSFS